jgi:hypothetical protein
VADKDKYGIPPGGNSGAWAAHSWGAPYTLTWDEMIAVVALSGWPQNLWAEAAATSAAESGRNPFVYNTYKKGHFGLFQVSRDAWPEFFAPNGEGMAWINPAENAKKGYAIYKAQGWGAWQAHSEGAHLAYLGQATAAAKKIAAHGGGTAYLQSLIRPQTGDEIIKRALASNPGAVNQIIGDAIAPGIQAGAEATAQATVDSGSAVASSVGDMATVVRDLWQALTTPALWMRVGYGVAGVVLVAGGLFLMVRTTATAQVAKQAGTVIRKAAG